MTTEKWLLDAIQKADMNLAQVARAAGVRYHRLYRALRGGYGLEHLDQDERDRVSDVVMARLAINAKTGELSRAR